MKKIILTSIVLISLFAFQHASASTGDPIAFLRLQLKKVWDAIGSIEISIGDLEKKVDEKRTMVIVDSEGKEVGLVADMSFGSQLYTVFDEQLELFYQVNTQANEIQPYNGSQMLYFVEPNCGGVPYMNKDGGMLSLHGVSKPSGVFFQWKEGVTPTNISIKSHISLNDSNNGLCIPDVWVSSPNDMAEVEPVEINISWPVEMVVK